MTISISTTDLSLTNFTAYDLPTKKWMRLIRPKMRLRIRAEHRDFISPTVTVDDRSLDGTGVCWSWSDDEQFSRPSFSDDEEFEVEIERRFLLRYKCIRRTKRMSLDQIRTGDDCALPLYDGETSLEILMLEDRIEMGEITFTLQGDARSESGATTEASTYSQ